VRERSRRVTNLSLGVESPEHFNCGVYLKYLRALILSCRQKVRTNIEPPLFMNPSLASPYIIFAAGVVLELSKEASDEKAVVAYEIVQVDRKGK